jgi:hypothetical protein
MALRAIAVLGLAAVPLNYAVLMRLLAIVETVRAGDPFVTANASRLQAIAWSLLALQLLSLIRIDLPATECGRKPNERGWVLGTICELGSCRLQPGRDT